MSVSQNSIVLASQALVLMDFLAFSVSPACANPHEWIIDAEHSSIKFSIKHLMVSNVNGQFKRFHGNVQFDGTALETASVNAVVDTNSIDTNVQARDEHLRGKQSFDCLKFPEILFKSNKIERNTDGSFKIFGTLSMHGISKDIVLNAKPLQALKKIDNGLLETATSATAELNRKDFGIFVDKALDHGGTVVGDKVKIALAITLKTSSH